MGHNIRIWKNTLRGRVLRAQAIERLGGRCVHCGLRDERVLQFDHIVPLARTGERRERVSRIVKEVLTDPRAGLRYQLLCANCHCIKTYQGLEAEAPQVREERQLREHRKAAAAAIPPAARDLILRSPLSSFYWANKLGVCESTVRYIRRTAASPAH